MTLFAAGVSAAQPWTKGAFQTKQYRNLFVEMGHSPEEVEARLQEVFHDVFMGPNKVYFEVGDSMGYISDIKTMMSAPKACRMV